MPIPTKSDLESAKVLVSQYAHKTPVLTNSYLNELSEGELYFKCENFQKVGAFKFRGAVNAVFSIDQDDLKNGVATHSSGNHAQALALAAKIRNIPAFIVMPNNAQTVKKKAVAGYGAEIIECEPTLEARVSTLENVLDETGAQLVHPYDNYKIIAGQGTAAMELCEQENDLDIIITPVGGGGLLSGTALAAKYFSQRTEVWAGEPLNADDAYQSLKLGKIVPSENPNTIADGLLTSLGVRNFEIINSEVKKIVTVTESEIIDSMKLIWERMKIIVEPSGAVPLAAILKDNVRNKRVGIVLSGGNIDLSHLPF